MGTITKSIGSDGRDYSTITLWDAALGGAAGGSGNDAIGEVYNDSAFDESPTVADNTPDTITLRAASGEEHDGTAGTGARIVRSTTASFLFKFDGTNIAAIETLEFDANRKSNSTAVEIITGSGNPSGARRLHRCLAHGLLTTSDTTTGVDCDGNTSVQNCLIYDIDNQAGGAAANIGLKLPTGSARDSQAFNCTVHNVNKNGTGSSTGISVNDDASNTCQNCIVTDTNNEGVGSAVDFSPASPSNATMDHNLSSDNTASGTGSLTSKASADQYVSNAEGSEDLHLASGADAIDAGSDLGTSPASVEIDIDGRDRDSEGDTWDIGADEYVAAPPASKAHVLGGGVGGYIIGA